MESYLHTWGYLASFIGTFLEGEVLLLSTIIAAQMGYMNMIGAVICVFSGAYIRDLVTFFIARKKGKSFVENNPKLNAKLNRVSSIMDRYPSRLLLSSRMLYGFTTVIVLVAGISNVSIKKFGLLSAASNVIWVAFYGTLSYFFAELLTENINWINQHKMTFIGTLAFIGLAYWFFIKRKNLFPG